MGLISSSALGSMQGARRDVVAVRKILHGLASGPDEMIDTVKLVPVRERTYFQTIPSGYDFGEADNALGWALSFGRRERFQGVPAERVQAVRQKLRDFGTSYASLGYTPPSGSQAGKAWFPRRDAERGSAMLDEIERDISSIIPEMERYHRRANVAAYTGAATVVAATAGGIGVAVANRKPAG